MPAPAVVILTLNEEANIAHAVESVRDWASEIFVVDSGSTDRTIEIASKHGCTVYSCTFDNYSAQRDWSITNIPFKSDWILFLDADECVTPQLKAEISQTLAGDPADAGFCLTWDFVWMGRILRRQRRRWVLRLFRREKGRCNGRTVNEHVVVDGSVGRIEYPLWHEDRKGLSRWIAKHLKYAGLEAAELARGRNAPSSQPADTPGTPGERMRVLQRTLYHRCPLLIRPFLMLLYDYIVKGGFLDGKEGLIYCVLHSFWYHLLIDLLYLENRTALCAGAENTTSSLAGTARGCAPDESYAHEECSGPPRSQVICRVPGIAVPVLAEPPGERQSGGT